MADAYKTIYQGQLPNTATVLVTVGVAKSWIIKHMTFVNTTGGAVTFQLFKNGTTAAFAWNPSAVSIPANGMAEWDGTAALATGETIAAVASAATSISAIIEGDEVS